MDDLTQETSRSISWKLKRLGSKPLKLFPTQQFYDSISQQSKIIFQSTYVEKLFFPDTLKSESIREIKHLIILIHKMVQMSWNVYDQVFNQDHNSERV